MSERTPVLMISKPVAPPWNDSSKNLVKDLALAGRRYRYHVLTPPGFRLPGSSVSEPIYRGRGAFSPALLQNLRPLRRLLTRDGIELAHFFFAPNPKASGAARLALFARPRRSIQTVCSCPASFRRAERLLFADRVVVLSEHTRQAFIAAGIPPARLTLIRPGIRIPAPLTHEQRLAVRRRHGIPADHAVVIYPGDYQFSTAAETVARAAVALRHRPGLSFVFACRIKQQASRLEEQRIRELLAAAGLRDRIRLYNDVPDIIELLGACDLCVLPAESLYAKMDLPLVLIEALALGVPLVVADLPPLNEILVGDVGLAVPPADPDALASAIATLLDNPALRGRLAQTAPGAARRHFAIEEISRQHEALYDEVLEA